MCAGGACQLALGALHQGTCGWWCCIGSGRAGWETASQALPRPGWLGDSQPSPAVAPLPTPYLVLSQAGSAAVVLLGCQHGRRHVALQLLHLCRLHLARPGRLRQQSTCNKELRHVDMASALLLVPANTPLQAQIKLAQAYCHYMHLLTDHSRGTYTYTEVQHV